MFVQLRRQHPCCLMLRDVATSQEPMQHKLQTQEVYLKTKGTCRKFRNLHQEQITELLKTEKQWQ